MRIKKLELRLHLSISKNLYLEISLSIPLAMQNHLPHGAASFLSLVAEVSDQRCNGCCEQFLSCQWMTSRSKTTVSKINYWIFLEFAYLPLLEFLRNPKMAMFNENIMVRLNCFARLQVAFQGVINQWTSCGSGMCQELNMAKTEATLILDHFRICRHIPFRL